MIQIYCDGEHGINKWLREMDGKVKVIDIKYALNHDGVGIMVVYENEPNSILPPLPPPTTLKPRMVQEGFDIPFKKFVKKYRQPNKTNTR